MERYGRVVDEDRAAGRSPQRWVHEPEDGRETARQVEPYLAKLGQGEHRQLEEGELERDLPRRTKIGVS